MKRNLGGLAALLGWAALALFGGPRAVEAGSIGLAAVSEASLLSSPGSTLLRSGPFSTFQVYSDLRVNAAITSGLEFDLSSIARGTPITSASFTYFVAGTQGVTSGPNLTVLGFASTDGVVTLSDLTTPHPIIVDRRGFPNNLPPGSVSIPTTLDVTSFVQSLINSGTPFAGFQFTTSQSSMLVWGSRAGASAPVLVISGPGIIPEPASALLMGLGIVGVVGAWSFRAARARARVACAGIVE